jgi:beta-galactosidase
MMSRFAIFCSVLLASSTMMTGTQAVAQQSEKKQTSARERINLDKGWKFAYGHGDDPARDFNHGLRPFFFAKAGYGDGPAHPDFNDAPWRKVDLPHDWAVELPFSSRGTSSHGSKAIGHNFPENSVGWYRKVLDIPASDKGRRISLEFDGVYRNSVLWVNGHYIGTEPSGYSGFRYDITDYVKFGEPNTIAVRADATVEEGWFYEGAGIYRHVWLTKTSPLHVAQWGTFVKSTVLGPNARLDVDTTITNDGKSAETFDIIHEVIAPSGRVAARGEWANLIVPAASSRDFAAELQVQDAQLWSLEHRHLYRLRTSVRSAGKHVDTYDTKFGIRTVTFDKDRGFFLNGKNIKLQGTNNHQDHAGVGAALPDALQTWRLNQLKSFGVNAYRASHNPPTPELLDEADRLGMLVLDEHRMMGTTPEIRGQLERLIRRDRNHPSVIIWSLGNEEWAIESSPLGTHLAQEMDVIAKRLDPTRRTMVAASSSGGGTSAGADVIGFNYGAQHDVDAFHKKFSDKPAMMSEEGSTLSTRGIYVDDRRNVHLNAYDRQGRPGYSLSIEEGWQRVVERPWMSGMFIWTGFDYRGEPTPFGWPAVSSQFGMLDTTGAYKDTAYYLKSVWKPEPMVHILPHWNWEGQQGKPMDVRVYSNADEVELLLNGRSLGRKTVVRNSHLKWDVAYAPGTLLARGYTAGKQIASTEVATAGAPAAIRLSPDKRALQADGSDVSVVWVNVADSRGRIHPRAENNIAFRTTGPIRIIGVGNGDPGSHEADRPAERHEHLPLSGWRSLAVNSVSDRPEVQPNVDTSGWRDPLAWLPPEAQPPLTEALVLRTSFEVPSLAEGNKVALFIAELHQNQQVFVNGRLVRPRRSEGALLIDLDPGQMPKTNSLAYVINTPEGGVPTLADSSVNGNRWGSLRVTHTAGPWQRRVFNGWAQVIVQSLPARGRGQLTAVGEGLKPASATFEVE